MPQSVASTSRRMSGGRAASGTRRPLPLAQPAAVRDPEWWIGPIRYAALAVWLGIPAFALLAQPYAGRVVWTVAVASLPLFIVLVGYHRWRRICPLAFINQIPVRLRRPGTRRMPPSVEARSYYAPFALFVAGLWLRLVATNGDGRAIAAFFVGLSLVALVFGAVFTGKSWCQYVCPVSFIEKIYTEPHGLRETRNSQCAKCTACKTACPDINQENGYWKELLSPSKRVAYFAYPGLVFGFYFYYFLQSGTWDYYFSGDWTDEPGLLATAFLPGHDAATAGFSFLPAVPRALASLLTLGACAGASYLLFSRLEPLVGRWWRARGAPADPRRARHATFALAAFVAFVTFYSFAGQPTLRKWPWLPPYVAVVVVATATFTLSRRLRRTQDDFAEEGLARAIVKRWQWPDARPPTSLHDAYLIHQSRSREQAQAYDQVLETYQAAVRESIASGLVTREDVQRLSWLRGRLQITQADHDRILAALADEEQLLLREPSRQLSAEKRLQLDAYRRALRQHVDRALAVDRPTADGRSDRLRAEYGVTEEEHAAILDEILGGDRDVALPAAESVRLVAVTTRTIDILVAEGAARDALLVDLLRRRRTGLVDRLADLLDLGDEQAAQLARRGLCSDEPGDRHRALELIRRLARPATAERLGRIERNLAADGVLPTTAIDALRSYVAGGEPHVRAAALQALAERGAADPETLERLAGDGSDLVAEVADALRSGAPVPGDGIGSEARLTTIEKMRHLRSIPLFASLEPTGLAELARASIEAAYADGQSLGRAGEPGHEAFVLLTGEVRVRRATDGQESVVEIERPGEVFGELAVIDPAPRAATMVAGPEGARVLRLDGAAFRRVLHADPAVAAGVLRTLARRLRADRPGPGELAAAD